MMVNGDGGLAYCYESKDSIISYHAYLHYIDRLLQHY